MLLLLWMFCAPALLKLGTCNSQNTMIQCDADYRPENCDLPNLNISSLETVEDFERCAPALLEKRVRNYYWSRAGKGITYRENTEAFERIRILNRVLLDVSDNEVTTKVLGHEIAFPIGVSPTAAHLLAHSSGENGTARAVSAMGTIMILSVYSTISLEEVAASFEGGDGTGQLWMQTYIYRNRSITADIVSRAEIAGFEAIVVTVDSSVFARMSCNAKELLRSMSWANFQNHSNFDMSATFEDLTWLCSITKLPVVAKGILTAEDALRAARACASAILVSNHGGRQLDAAPATIDVLPEIAKAMKGEFPQKEVYLDGGVRTGSDVFKALMRGAKAVFIGKPVLWGLTVGGEEGVKKVLDILKTEFNETMLLAGYASPEEIDEGSSEWNTTTKSPVPVLHPDSRKLNLWPSINENFTMCTGTKHEKTPELPTENVTIAVMYTD